ncbi:MAG: signal peptide peptidase SppA [Pirellulales bacterium]|jgi:protease-4|nr:signal peptide peptidase SppA [Thermoguttaceae bacterium]MDD4787987.1 signal peptide peptidase SppA [Pirellulales bacterium]
MEPIEPQGHETIVQAQVAPQAADPPGYYPPQRRGRGGGLLLFFILILVIALGCSFLLNLALLANQTPSRPGRALQEEYIAHDKFQTGTDKVAIVSVNGAILGYEGYLKQQIDQASADEHVKAVVLRIDSPGGTVSASDYYYHHLSRLRTESNKPIVVSMGAIAASGGYYLSMAAGPNEKTVFAEPTTFTGSIGVVIPHYNFSGLLDQFGIEEDSVASHRLKTMGSLAREMTEEERAIFQQLVDEGFARFKAIIRANRPTFQDDGEALEKLATGQIFTAEQAKRAGLVDEIGFLEEAVDRAIELAGLDRNNVQVIRYKRTLGLGSLLLGANARGRAFDLAQMIDLSAPRPYYLATQLPLLVRSGD